MTNINEYYSGTKTTEKKINSPKDMKNFDLNRENHRRISFNGYDNRKKINTELMALTGLFYDANAKEVKCNFCKYIANFQSDDEIIRFHHKFSRNCPLITRRKTLNVPLNEAELDLTLPPLIYDECGTGHRFTNASPVYREFKHPNFSLCEERRQTYKGWPKQMRQTPEMLVECGLFYTNEGDKVKCYDCGLGLRDWEDDDEPWIEHTKFSKHCHYIDFVKGRDFVEEVKKYCEKHGKKPIATKSENELQLLKSPENKCKNCRVGLAEVNLLPCNHTDLCAICALETSKCMTCKTSIECRVRLYF